MRRAKAVLVSTAALGAAVPACGEALAVDEALPDRGYDAAHDSGHDGDRDAAERARCDRSKPFGAPMPVPIAATGKDEGGARLSADERVMTFHADGQIFVTDRPTADSDFAPPRVLVTAPLDAATMNGALTEDGKTIVFDVVAVDRERRRRGVGRRMHRNRSLRGGTLGASRRGDSRCGRCRRGWYGRGGGRLALRHGKRRRFGVRGGGARGRARRIPALGRSRGLLVFDGTLDEVAFYASPLAAARVKAHFAAAANE